MSILVGVDFTEPSARAATAAAHLSMRMQMPLHLVHVVDAEAKDILGGPGKSLATWAEAQLNDESERLKSLGAAVTVHIGAGSPDDLVLAKAKEIGAQLIVLAPSGRRKRISFGSHVDRIAQGALVPVLVVRDHGPFQSWAAGARPLRVLVGTDGSVCSFEALGWVQSLRRLAPCEVTAVELYWPPEKFERLGLSGVRSLLDPDPEVTRALEGSFHARKAALPDTGPITYRSLPHLGRVADRLVELAAEAQADLIVVGRHLRSQLERLWEGSVSRGVLKHASISVACVPLPGEKAALAQPVPRVERVLVATDFSAVGDRAVPLAYAVVGKEGTVHLLHVVAPQERAGIAPRDIFAATSKESEAARQMLVQRVPSNIADQTVRTELHVLSSAEPAVAICQAAERLDADMICLGTHGASAIRRALMGSTAQSVLANSAVPVLLARVGKA